MTFHGPMNPVVRRLRDTAPEILRALAPLVLATAVIMGTSSSAVAGGRSTEVDSVGLHRGPGNVRATVVPEARAGLGPSITRARRPSFGQQLWLTSEGRAAAGVPANTAPTARATAERAAQAARAGCRTAAG